MFTLSHSLTRLALPLSLILSACGGSDDSSDGDDHDHDHTEERGRLVLLNSSTNEAVVHDLHDADVISRFVLDSTPSALYASADHRYALLVDRSGDQVYVLDGGIWEEDHGDHQHPYAEDPNLFDEVIEGSRPTHVVKGEDSIAVFFDGDASTMTPASVTTFEDRDLIDGALPASQLQYDINMHGVAEPHHDVLLSTIRPDDADSLSANPILPDRVGVFAMNDGQYTLEATLADFCPDLHGAAQNARYVAFGCSDGVLIAERTETGYVSSKLANPDNLPDGLRIGTLYGHAGSDQFVAVASQHGGAVSYMYSVDPSQNRISDIDWQPVEEASPVSRHFSFEGDYFYILDSLGQVTVLEPQSIDGNTEWHFGLRISTSDAAGIGMPEGLHYSMTESQSDGHLYVYDPIAERIAVIEPSLFELTERWDVNYSASRILWLGIKD